MKAYTQMLYGSIMHNTVQHNTTFNSAFNSKSIIQEANPANSLDVSNPSTNYTDTDPVSDSSAESVMNPI